MKSKRIYWQADRSLTSTYSFRVLRLKARPVSMEEFPVFISLD